MLLFVGYSWPCDVGTGTDSASLLASRLMAILCGFGTAFRLDEFGMRLNLRDLYWAREGRGIEAVILFAALLAAGAWGAVLSANPRSGNANRRHPNPDERATPVLGLRFLPPFSG